MSKKNLLLLNKAIEFINEKHEGQTYGENPFVYHPLQVYEIIKLIKPEDYELQIAALLHDCYENTATTEKEIEKAFGKNISQLVTEVTKTSYNTFPKLKSTRGVILKFADRLANLSNMKDWSEEAQQRYVNKSKFWKS